MSRVMLACEIEQFAAQRIIFGNQGKALPEMQLDQVRDLAEELFAGQRGWPVAVQDLQRTMSLGHIMSLLPLFHPDHLNTAL